MTKSFELTFLGIFLMLITHAQPSDHPLRPVRPFYSAFDSVYASRIPVLEIPANLRSRSLPAVIDNSSLSYWPGIIDQHNYYACQQFSGVAYVFGYEINRLRNQPGWYWENRYPPHYTWNFLNHGEQYAGVNFFQSFEFIRQQGHINQPDWGVDTAHGTLGWINGYDSYYRGMFNRLKSVSSIKVNSEEGILTLKNYLYDHLDGSPTGGIACFTTSGQGLYSMPTLPPGTPEAGKNIVLSWVADPTHGMSIVGYNDSVRYDLNKDGLYTNNLDINGDGIVDARDWEIGAFKFANSYGTWWGNDGFAYVLYSAMASYYGSGGVWNNSVYVVEADPDYQPLLTVKVSLEFNQRDKIRLLAGISRDTTYQMPEYFLEFPMFNFQGGKYPMQGIDSIAGKDTIEFGLDISPLLSFVDPGSPCRLFFLVEERDQNGTAHGKIKRVEFMVYGNNPGSYLSSIQDIPIERNDFTVVSAIAQAFFSKVQIISPQLPSYQEGQPYAVQLQAASGRKPYQWSLVEPYLKSPIQDTLPPSGGQKLFPINYLKPYAIVVLPFSFPFYGKKYDTLYVNFNGFVSIDEPYLPLPYVTDEMSMMKQSRIISPAFSQEYLYYDELGDGLWSEISTDGAFFRWKSSLDVYDTASHTNFGLRLFPDGRFDFLYGKIQHPYQKHAVYSGLSQGNGENYLISPHWDAGDLNNQAFSFIPVDKPENLILNESGLLTITHPDTTRISDIRVKVTDAGHISDYRTFQLSDGLIISAQMISGDDGKLIFGREARFNLTLTNQGTLPLQNLSLKLQSCSQPLIVTDSLAELPRLNPGQTLIVEDAFTFHLDHPLPDQYPITLHLVAENLTTHREKSLNIIVSSHELQLSTMRIDDGADRMLQPGEVADLVIPVRNTGSVSAINLNALLTSADTMVHILSDPVVTIGQLSPMAVIELKFRLKASRAISPGEKKTLHFSLSNQSVSELEYPFELTIGKLPVALVKLSSNTSSADSMALILDSLEVPYQIYTSLPSPLEHISCVFVLLGVSNQGSHIITDNEGSALAAYLDNGGKLYMEGYSNWYYSSNPSIQPKFKYTSARVPIYHYDTIHGVHQTLGDSLSFMYTNALNYAIFSFEPVEPAYTTFTHDANPTRPMEIVYDGEGYQTIASMLEFASLKDIQYPAQKIRLVKRYLEFFRLNTSGLYALFHAEGTSICAGNTVSFTDDSYDHVLSRQWEFPGGNPSSSTDPHPVVSYPNPGLYDVRLSVSDGLHNQFVMKKEYIRVNQCQGMEDQGSGIKFSVYPNPATHRVVIKSSNEITEFSLKIFDLSGRLLLQNKPMNYTPADHFTADVSSLRPGIYFLFLFSDKGSGRVKLLIR